MKLPNTNGHADCEKGWNGAEWEVTERGEKREEEKRNQEKPEEYDPGSRPFEEVFQDGQMQLDFDSRCLGELDLGEEMGEVEELVI